MVYRSRSETVQHTDTVQLIVKFTDLSGTVTDLDSFPQVTIIQPDGNVILGPTSSGVSRISTGIYEYDYTTGLNDLIGVWTDLWTGTMDGYARQKEGSFVVIDTNLPQVNSDGYVALGDDPGFDYSQVAIQNINKCLKALRARLNSSGKAKAKDKYGNDIYVSCDIFSTDVLTTMLAMSLSGFNQIPHTSGYTWDDTEFFKIYLDVIVQGAAISALASKQLIEKGREFTVTDNGISFSPPTISEVIGSQYSNEMTNHTEKVKSIKASMKPFPLGLGGLNISSANKQPVISQLRHRRAKQVI